MKKNIQRFKQRSKKEKIGHICVYGAIVLFLVFLYFFNTSIKKLHYWMKIVMNLFKLEW